MTTLDDYGGWPGVLGTLAAGRDIGPGEARAALGSILAGEATDAQVAAFIIALRLKSPSADEMHGLVMAMRDAATPLDLPPGTIDIVGTGGTAERRSHALNVSTMASVVAAAAGAVVCKHGNVKASSTSGSFDLLAALGVDIALTPDRVSAMVHTVGLGFAFAKTFHPAMRHVAAVRTQIGIPTVFNLLGPLAHPGRVDRQVLGVAEAGLAPQMAEVLRASGSVRSMVVHGDGRFDELCTTGPNLVIELRDGELREFEFDAADVGLRPASHDDLIGGDAEANKGIFKAVLVGEPRAVGDMIALNAAAGLVVAEVVDDLVAGIEAAYAAINDGRAALKLDEVVRASRS